MYIKYLKFSLLGVTLMLILATFYQVNPVTLPLSNPSGGLSQPAYELPKFLRKVMPSSGILVACEYNGQQILQWPYANDHRM